MHMETKNEPLSAQESLSLIESMIRETKGTVSNNSFYFLLWGWVIAFCNFGMFAIMRYTEYPQYAPAVWILTFPAWAITMVYGSRQSKSRGIVSHLDRINMWLWIAMAITIAPAWALGSHINWMVNAVILMPVGMATFVSGVIIRLTPLKMGGILFWASGVLCYFVEPSLQYIIGGVAVMLGYLIPGYLLKAQRETHA